MEAYYSSDEEIAWGPVTLREIKSDLKRSLVRKPNRRHTILGKLANTEMDESLSKETNKSNVSGTSTAYYTPNESLKTNGNSDFLEKLTHVINIPSSELSEYASILEDAGNSSSQSEVSNVQNEPLIVPHIIITKIDTPSHDDTCANFINALENRKTDCDIENFQQSLVENTYIESENEENSEEDSTNKIKTSLATKLVMEEEVIILSDNSVSSVDSCDIDDINYDEKHTLAKKDIDIDTNEREYELHDNILKCNVSEERYESNSDNRSSNEINSCEDVDEYNCEEDFLATPNMQHRLSTIKESLSTSPVIVPEIDLTQFDDSVKDDSLQLNDTLEEMNALLRQGLNYSMPDDERIENTPVDKDLTPKQFSTPSNEITANKQLLSGGKEKASSIPRRKYVPTSTEKKFNTFTVTKASPKSNFKVPDLPPRLKLFNPTPPKSCTNLKNVVSPVALYIKNSPRIPLKQNVKPRELSRMVAATAAKSANKENSSEFPEVVYEPSKKQITSTEKHIAVAPYMRKLNITEGHLTKHEGRINGEQNRSNVSRKLLETDITMDQSLSNTSGDVSVLTNKQAFIK